MLRGKLLRWLHLGHRWLGVVLGLMVLLWFISGLVMLYVPRPQLSETERLENLPLLVDGSVRVSPLMAWQTLELPGAPLAVRLNAADGRPAYRFLTEDRWWAVSAETGLALGDLDAKAASRIAQPYLAGAAITQTDAVDLDQWTVYRQYNPLRPFWRVELNDGRHYYVSTRSGEAALDTRTAERAWNWLGSVVHWLYFTPLRQQTLLWRSIVLWSSFVALLLAVSGVWLGWLRLRLKHRYRGERITPYRTFWKRWHHLLGLAGGICVATWLLSGWLSLAPLGLANSPGLEARANGPVSLVALSPLSKLSPDTREVEWISVGGLMAMIEKYPGDTSITLPGRVQQSRLSLADIQRSIEAVQAAPIACREWLQVADTRYFSLRHYPRQFPVARITLADRDGTVLYVSPRNGRVELISNHHDFAHRWLYQGLHRFDFPILVEHPLLRDLLIILFLLIGAALSFAGCVLALGRLRVTRRS